MNNSVFVGNLPFGITKEEISELFGTVGKVTKVDVIRDRVTGKERGFGFVEFEDEKSAAEAVKVLGRKQLKGRVLNIKVNEPRKVFPRRDESENEIKVD